MDQPSDELVRKQQQQQRQKQQPQRSRGAGVPWTRTPSVTKYSIIMTLHAVDLDCVNV